jgi:hypothetical protein
MLTENTGMDNLTQASIYSRMSDSPVDDKRLRETNNSTAG